MPIHTIEAGAARTENVPNVIRNVPGMFMWANEWLQRVRETARAGTHGACKHGEMKRKMSKRRCTDLHHGGPPSHHGYEVKEVSGLQSRLTATSAVRVIFRHHGVFFIFRTHMHLGRICCGDIAAHLLIRWISGSHHNILISCLSPQLVGALHDLIYSI